MASQIIQSAKERMPWTIASRVLKSVGLQTSQGWEKTIARLGEIRDVPREERLKELLLEHTLCGEKLTKFYDISESDKARLLGQMENIPIDESIFSWVYPCNVDVRHFNGTDSAQILVSRFKNEDGIGIVFTSEMRITKREIISDPTLFADPDSVIRSYDEIIGLKFQSVQLFNVIWLSHHDNLVEIRVDNPRGMLPDAAHQIHSGLKATVNGMLGSRALNMPRDLFPLIESIYDDADEGKVVELGFSTSTGSVKLEKMRRTRTCLRHELYHVGGKRELKTKISPYRVSVRWDFGTEDMPYQPELTLAGTSRGQFSVGAPGGMPMVTGAAISNCVGCVDYEDVRARIVRHLNKISAQAEKEKAVAAE